MLARLAALDSAVRQAKPELAVQHSDQLFSDEVGDPVAEELGLPQLIHALKTFPVTKKACHGIGIDQKARRNLLLLSDKREEAFEHAQRRPFIRRLGGAFRGLNEFPLSEFAGPRKWPSSSRRQRARQP